MPTMRHPTITALGILALSGAAWAQSSAPEVPVTPEAPAAPAAQGTVPGPTTPTGEGLPQSEARGGRAASQLIGASLLTQGGEEIGEIVDLVIGSDDRVEAAIVEAGGLAGLGSRMVGVAFGGLESSREGEFTVDLTEQEIEALPSYTLDAGMWVTAGDD
jgi:hypothetical protein